MTRRALILIDIQNDYFPGGKWTLDGIEAASDNAVELLAAARKAGDMVVHVRHEFPSDQAPFFTPGSDGARTHSKILPKDGERQVLKNNVNAFQGTDLKRILDADAIKDVVICGAMSNMCIDAATRAASDFGYSVTVVHDACAARGVEEGGVTVPASQVHAASMASLGFAYAKTVSTDAFLGAA